MFNETRSILEPAGAVAVAGAKAYLQHYGLSGQTVVAVTSGANMNFDRLRLVAGGRLAPLLVQASCMSLHYQYCSQRLSPRTL